MKQKLKKFILILLILGIAMSIIVFAINYHVKATTKNQILKNGEYANLKDIDCILVLGAGIWGDEPSPILEDRLLEGIKLYEEGVSPKIMMTGDNGTNGYDEVNVMKNYAKKKGVPSEDIFMDHAGFSTYESVYRAQAVFEVKRVVIVTQEYHLHRAIRLRSVWCSI